VSPQPWTPAAQVVHAGTTPTNPLIFIRGIPPGYYQIILSRYKQRISPGQPTAYRRGDSARSPANAYGLRTWIPLASAREEVTNVCSDSPWLPRLFTSTWKGISYVLSFNHTSFT